MILVKGFCPMCATPGLLVENGDGILRCSNKDCPRPTAASDILSDPEIHHVVRFDSDSQTFNVKHPLRERIDGELLDCAIHDEVCRWCADGGSTTGTWRLKRRDDVPGEESNEWPWLWERL